MKIKENYIDRTLVRLRRQYSKDEVVAGLNSKLKEKDIEIGKLLSEIDYLNNKLKNGAKEINRLAKIEARKEELYQLKDSHVKCLRKEIKKLKTVIRDLVVKNKQSWK